MTRSAFSLVSIERIMFIMDISFSIAISFFFRSILLNFLFLKNRLVICQSNLMILKKSKIQIDKLVKEIPKKKKRTKHKPEIKRSRERNLGEEKKGNRLLQFLQRIPYKMDSSFGLFAMSFILVCWLGSLFPFIFLLFSPILLNLKKIELLFVK